MKSLSLTFLLAVSALVVAIPLASDPVICQGELITLSETFIGKNNDVKMEYTSCKGTQVHQKKSALFEARQANATNVCGANCNTNCFTPSGGGPDPNECHVIADALRFASENTGAIFPIPTGANATIVMSYRSCRSFFVNQDLGPLAYCRTDWADLIDFIAPNCQSTQNAHGGNCVATDQRWFVQVQHS
ncbi:hypothetical protein BDQ12DRAFT_690677 [Crucibulum laeve]|uniref:Uncharacterized protein n=1 Tax=Crucibulum laeve TaxID=68775 RepID=A0A5C3LLW7_9AGAR|nr:hypothetical protein BDQ12DRAFT_690677 [Crucibulum laeve]